MATVPPIQGPTSFLVRGGMGGVDYVLPSGYGGLPEKLQVADPCSIVCARERRTANGVRLTAQDAAAESKSDLRGELELRILPLREKAPCRPPSFWSVGATVRPAPPNPARDISIPAVLPAQTDLSTIGSQPASSAAIALKPCCLLPPSHGRLPIQCPDRAIWGAGAHGQLAATDDALPSQPLGYYWREARKRQRECR
jgi:hypothetical protein